MLITPIAKNGYKEFFNFCEPDRQLHLHFFLQLQETVQRRVTWKFEKINRHLRLFTVLNLT